MASDFEKGFASLDAKQALTLTIATAQWFKAEGRNQRVVAEKLNEKYQTLRSYFCGRRPMRASKFNQIMAVFPETEPFLNEKLKELLKGDGNV